MIIFGIDPGLDGAVAAINTFGEARDVQDTPTLTMKRGKSGKKRVYNVPVMVGLLRVHEYAQCVHVYMERVHAMPGQGVTSMFSMGMGLGVWEGIVTTLGYSLHYVTPQAWKKVMMAGMPKEKGASVVKAIQLWPSEAGQYTTKRGRKLDGRADAMLIAEYGRLYSGTLT